MRKIKGILVCLLVMVAFRLMAVEYQPIEAFGSTSAYMGERSYQPVMSSGRTQASGSLSAISASNFEELNGEGGAMYRPGSIRKGRPGGGGDSGGGGGESSGSGAIGELDFHSPVGDTPWILLALLSAGYAVRRIAKRKLRIEN